MHVPRILSISFLVALTILALAVARIGLSGYASVLSGAHEFGYKFDRSRLRRWGYTVLTVMGICFVYGLIVTGQIAGGLAFCLIVLPFSALGCLLSVCYVPRKARNKT